MIYGAEDDLKKKKYDDDKFVKHESYDHYLR
jgi:hypothetical protein